MAKRVVSWVTKFPRQTKIEKKRHMIQVYLDKHMTLAEVAEKLDVSVKTLSAYIKRNEWITVPPRPKKTTGKMPEISQEQQKLIWELIAGYSKKHFKSIHLKFGHLANLNDLQSRLALAAVKAIPKYDEAKGASLKTFLHRTFDWAAKDYKRELWTEIKEKAILGFKPIPDKKDPHSLDDFTREAPADQDNQDEGEEGYSFFIALPSQPRHAA